MILLSAKTYVIKAEGGHIKFQQSQKMYGRFEHLKYIIKDIPPSTCAHKFAQGCFYVAQYPMAFLNTSNSASSA